MTSWVEYAAHCSECFIATWCSVMVQRHGAVFHLPLNIPMPEAKSKLVSLDFNLPCSEEQALAGWLSQGGACFLDSSDGSGESSLRFWPRWTCGIDGNGALGFTQASQRLAIQGLADPVAGFQKWLDHVLATVPAGGPHGPGVVIFASYDLAHLLDPAMPKPRALGPRFPLLYAGCYSWSLRRSSAGKWRLECVEEEDSLSAADLARQLRDLALGAKRRPVVPVLEKPAALWSRGQYGSAFREFKEAIARGDAYVGNLTQRFVSPMKQGQTLNVVDLYLDLRRSSPASHACFLEVGNGELGGGLQHILSSSPERFLRVRLDGDRRRIETCPIKGTRAVDADAGADRAAQESLLASEKERAELTMIVDLERNDLGRVAKTGTVSVPSLGRLVSHGYVHHLHAEVCAELRDNVTFTDLLRACFPGGSVTGCPKVSAMKILASLEPHARGPYTGSVLALDSAGNLDSNILIRTILCEPGCVDRKSVV